MNNNVKETKDILLNNEKEAYETPTFAIIRIEQEDIIKTSSFGDSYGDIGDFTGL